MNLLDLARSALANIAGREAFPDVARYRWRVTLPGGSPFEVCALPELTRAEMAALYPGTTLEPLPDALDEPANPAELATAANDSRAADQGDDRRSCTDCANLAKRKQRCLAAWRGKAPEGAGRDYRPSLDLPRRCERYRPKQA